jgi:cytidine deaminase
VSRRPWRTAAPAAVARGATIASPPAQEDTHVDPSESPPLQPGDAELVAAARAVRERAHAGYSAFAVGAALRTRAGRVVVGCNVENASYGLTVCAERSAVFAAVAAEGSAMRVDTVVIASEARSCPPCGACRQVLAEFGRDARVVFPHRGGTAVMTVGELLPVAFELAPPARPG